MPARLPMPAVGLERPRGRSQYRVNVNDPGKHPPHYRKRAAACRRQISDSSSRLRLRDAIDCPNLKRNKRAERVSSLLDPSTWVADEQ
jgi:hypothetical protein